MCASLLAACGGSSHKPNSKNTPYGPRNSPYAMSKCMRANGLSNFPDPIQGSGGLGFPGGVVLSSTGQLTVDGVSFSGPALKKAQAVCKEFLPGGGGPPPALTAQQRRHALELATCMRAHGVPNFPDPGSGGPGPGTANKQSLISESSSPAFQHAVHVCGHGQGLRFRVNSNVAGP